MNSNKEQTKNFKVDFIISGVMKGGTTAARSLMSQHPKLHLSPNEPGFFVKNIFDKGLTWYEEQFKIPNNFTGLVGEKTPRYCVCPDVFARIKKTFPDVKILMFLRDPVSRMYSQWNHLRTEFPKSREIPSFRTYVTSMKSGRTNSLNPYNRGVYIKQLKKIVNSLGRENLYVAITERCRKNTLEEYNKIFNFLDVSELSEHQLKPRDYHKRPYSAPMHKKERDYLQEFYKPYNEQLFEFLGYEIDEWKVSQ